MNINELIVGAIFGLCFYPVIGFWCFLLAALTSGLWAAGGTYWKPLRRVGVPLVTALATGYFWAGLATVAILHIGYGVRDANQDKGSTLGEFFYKICACNLWWTNFCTRAFIYALLFMVYAIEWSFKR